MLALLFFPSIPHSPLFASRGFDTASTFALLPVVLLLASPLLPLWRLQIDTLGQGMYKVHVEKPSP
jgi:hypothetical protein